MSGSGSVIWCRSPLLCRSGLPAPAYLGAGLSAMRLVPLAPEARPNPSIHPHTPAQKLGQRQLERMLDSGLDSGAPQVLSAASIGTYMALTALQAAYAYPGIETGRAAAFACDSQVCAVLLCTLSSPLRNGSSKQRQQRSSAQQHGFTRLPPRAEGASDGGLHMLVAQLGDVGIRRWWPGRLPR